MKIRHILKKEEFSDIFSGGRKLQGARMAVYIKDSPGKETAVGLVISKRMAPLAVTRNYLRRLIYAYFRDIPETKKKNKRRIIQITSPIKKTKRKNLARDIQEELKSLLEKE